MRNIHCSIWNIVRKTEKNVKNEKETLKDLNYGQNKQTNKQNNNNKKKGKKKWKMRHKHCITWNMARNKKKVNNEKCTQKNLEYGEKTVKQGK